MSDDLIPTSRQERILAIVPKISGSLSMFGSGFIVYDILRNKRKRQKPLYRILLAMSACDWMASFCYFMSTWPIPRGSQFVYGAAGTQASCNAQGFFIQLGVAAPFYNSCLSILYLLMIRYNFSDAKLTKRVELYMHAFALLFPLATALAAIPLELYNNSYIVCWLSEYPIGCVEDDNCIRGGYSFIYRKYFFGVPMVLVIFVATCNMGFVYWTVRTQERKNMRYSSARVSWALRKSRVVATQGLWFLLPFYITWVPLITMVLLDGGERMAFAVALGASIFQPCQGFFNFIVYRRLRLIAYARRLWKHLFSRKGPSLSRQNLSVPGHKDHDAEMECAPVEERDTGGLGAHKQKPTAQSPECLNQKTGWTNGEVNSSDLRAVSSPALSNKHSSTANLV